MPNPGNGVGQRRRQLAGPLPVAFEQVKGNPLRGLLPDAWHAAQPVNQADK